MVLPYLNMIANYDDYDGTQGSTTFNQAEIRISTDSTGTIIIDGVPMGSSYREKVIKKPVPFVPPYHWTNLPNEIPLQENPIVKRLWQSMVLPRWPPGKAVIPQA